MNVRLRDPASRLHLAVGAISRNLAFIFFDMSAERQTEADAKWPNPIVKETKMLLTPSSQWAVKGKKETALALQKLDFKAT